MIQSWDGEAERELIADACRNSFYWFVHEAWGLDYNPAIQSFYDSRIHDPIIEWFQQHTLNWLAGRRDSEPRQTHLAVLIPREFLKSGLITKAGQCWLHLHDTELATYTGSQDVELAEDILSSIKAVISGRDGSARFTWLYGNWEDPTRVWRTGEVVHAARRGLSRHEPSFGTWGVKTGFVGVHVDALFFDDPISYPRLEQDSEWMDKVNDHITSLGPILKTNGLEVWPGTRYGDGDHFGTYLNLQKIKSMSGHPLPGELNIDKEIGLWHTYYMSGRNPDGTPSHPKVWPEWRLKEEEQKDPNKYAAQVLNNPLLSVLNPLSIAQVADCWIDEKHVPWDCLYIAFHGDLAFKYPDRLNKGDESVIIVSGHERTGTGNVYFLEAHGSNAWKAEDYYTMFQHLLQKYQPPKYRILGLTQDLETGGQAGSAELLYRNYAADVKLAAPAIYCLNRSVSKKIPRIMRASTFWRMGHVKMVKGATGLLPLAKQMSHILTTKRKDYMDAAADAFAVEIYMPHRPVAGNNQMQPRLRRPGDDILQTGRALETYEDEEASQRNMAYEPIDF